MSTQNEEILSTLCSQVKLNLANDFQHVYMLANRSEARLAYDVLLSHGFEVKLYNDTSAEDQSTLYITNQPDTSQTAQRYANALLYARSLKPLKQQLDTLWTPEISPEFHGYSMTFTTVPGNQSAKQIVILINSSLPAIVNAAPPPRPVAESSESKTVASPAMAQVKRKKKKKKPQPGQEDFRSGPALTRKLYPGEKKLTAEEENRFTRQLYLYIRGNSAMAFVAFIALVVVPAIVLFTLFGMAKGFLCPDLATAKKNTAWYCFAPVDPHKVRLEEP